MSSSLGLASGVLIATIAFEMMPRAIEFGSLFIATSGFAAGFAAVYLFDLFVHGWRKAGVASDQRRKVLLFYQRRRPKAGEATVLAGGTSAEELIEGIAIGAGTLVEPNIGLLIALAIAIDNLSEGLSIGELVRSESPDRRKGDVTEIIGWTSAIGIALVVSSMAGWLLLRGLSAEVLGFLFALGAGGMFYLTVTDLLPQAEERQYQESSAIATGIGFLIMLILFEQT